MYRVCFLTMSFYRLMAIFNTMEAKFTINQIAEDPIFKKFLQKKSGIQPATIKNYLYSWRSFCNFTGKTPTEIHDTHRDDLRNRVPEFDMWLNEALDEFVSHLIASGNLHGGILLNVSKIKSLLHAFKLRPTPKIEITKKPITEDAKHALKVEDIRKAIKHSNPTYQAIIITQAQSGLSISDALLLDVEDFIMAVSNKGEDLTVKEAIYRVKTDDNIIGCFDLRRKKSTIEFYTFIGPEALRSIASLLEHRDEEYLQPKTPIFMKDISRLRKAKRAQLLKDLRIKPRTAMNYLERMHDRGLFPFIELDSKKRTYFRTHKLRKWFSNQLRFKAGFNSDDVKYLMGQKTGDVLEHYIDTNNYQALKANYRKSLPYLAINDEIIMEENQEAIDSLTRELQEERRKREAMEKMIQEMDLKNRKIDARLDEILTNKTVLEELTKR